MWLYVTDLHTSVTESDLYRLFERQGKVLDARVERASVTGQSLGYGSIRYAKQEDAWGAFKRLNLHDLNGKRIRIEYSPVGAAHIFVKNLGKDIHYKELYDMFSKVGNIRSCMIAKDDSGQSKGHGLVLYDSEEAGQSAIEKLNGIELHGRPVYVERFRYKNEREMVVEKAKRTNLYVSNLSKSVTEEYLKEIFGKFGTISSAAVMRDADGNSKCFGFVKFESADDAARAVEFLNGPNTDNKEWYVGIAQKKSDRELELKNRFEQTVKEAADKSQGLKLYIKDLDDSIGDDKLKELFSPFGIITSCKVMRDPRGVSWGSGFVAFSTPEEASRALLEMNGKMIVSKPLFVAHAQRKEVSGARLQAQFSQMRAVAIVPSVAPCMPINPPCGLGLGQQIFSEQAPPAITLPQGQYPCGRHAGGVPEQQGQQSVPLMQQQAQLSQMCPVAVAPLVSPCMPICPSGGHGLGQQIFRGQAPPAITPPQQQLVPGTRPGQLPIPNFFVPLVQQGQYPGGRRAGGVPVQQQMLPRGQIYHYPTGRGLPDVSMSGVAQGMISIPYHIIGGMPLRDGGMSQPTPIGSLASALPNVSPADQRTMLG